jgi:hypothetical protein
MTDHRFLVGQYVTLDHNGPTRTAGQEVSRQPRMWVAAAVVLIGLALVPNGAGAQNGARAEAADGPTRGRAAPGNRVPSALSDADPGAKAQREDEARQRAWDRETKAVTRSICKGC